MFIDFIVFCIRVVLQFDNNYVLNEYLIISMAFGLRLLAIIILCTCEQLRINSKRYR